MNSLLLSATTLLCNSSKRHLCQELINLPPSAIISLYFPQKVKTPPKKCISLEYFTHVLLSSPLCLSGLYGRQDVNRWPTWSPMCLSGNTSTRRISTREVRPSHPDAANLLPASHVNKVRHCLEHCLFCMNRDTAKEINKLKLRLHQV